MEKIWFIEINDKIEGPYSFNDLKQDIRITPDTLIWKPGFSKWVPIRVVYELKDLFADEASEKPIEKPKPEVKVGKEALILDYQSGFPPYIFWMLISLIAIIYLFYRMSQIS